MLLAPQEGSDDTGFSGVWAVLDMDGDGKPDLAETADPSQSTLTVWGGNNGSPYWKVYRASP
ncbi:MAG TPA: hypothetical protein VGK67_20430 [Myxococcales bacterium]|jgi:hypothetical protein